MNELGTFLLTLHQNHNFANNVSCLPSLDFTPKEKLSSIFTIFFFFASDHVIDASTINIPSIILLGKTYKSKIFHLCHFSQHSWLSYHLFQHSGHYLFLCTYSHLDHKHNIDIFHIYNSNLLQDSSSSYKYNTLLSHFYFRIFHNLVLYHHCNFLFHHCNFVLHLLNNETYLKLHTSYISLYFHIQFWLKSLL